ncbi:MAG: 4Fe-4S double cluster binding domain-containing protein [Spirochaetales bacterium]|nr:4Fe-4S double cluster binding domain-containing protein [Spirochaetales bacterium]
MLGKQEDIYTEFISHYKEKVVTCAEDSPMQGFEYFDCREYRTKINDNTPLIVKKLTSNGVKGFFSVAKIMKGCMGMMLKATNRSYKELEPYLSDLEKGKAVERTEHPLLADYPNKDLWDELNRYAWDRWRILLGFTELTDQFVFKGKSVLFSHALVCIQEMDKEKIDQAPDYPAGEEVLGVYRDLGVAVNDIALWLRTRGIRSQANHPLGGLTNTSPLAAKAGMGWQGCNGLLITPQFGQRLRIAPVFIEGQFFEYTDSREHDWIEAFCAKCGKCLRSCPTGAIYKEKVDSQRDVPGIDSIRTCIDREKCFPYFNKTLGCSVCVKVCPFSQGPDRYEKLKKATLRTKSQSR